jgi:hypothetical protein
LEPEYCGYSGSVFFQVTLFVDFKQGKPYRFLILFVIFDIFEQIPGSVV